MNILNSPVSAERATKKHSQADDKGVRLFVCSTINGEQLEYFVPAGLASGDFSSFPMTHRVERHDPSTGATAPLAAMITMRGRAMLSRDVLVRSRSLRALSNLWRGKRLDAVGLCSLHASAIGHQAPSRLRDSAVWVDGLRPKDAALIPCPSSMVPSLLEDYFSFMARSDLPYWIRLAIGHYQLLMIHPFFDGNGRLSRLVALLHAQRFVPSIAMAIAAALALQRRALRGVLDGMRQGDTHSYLEHWSKLLSACDAAMAAIASLWCAAKCTLSEALNASETSHRIVRMVLDEPIFSREDFALRLNLSQKLSQSWLDKLVQSAIVESHVGIDGRLEYHCPIGVEFWRQSMETLDTSCSETFAETQGVVATVIDHGV